ncbi:hypothetical protein H0H92_005754 [Tricholoma furcatifolium]|nr:hypothetical protein H0H92_005754 [Tricholoma furcatifolium]
MTLFVPLDGGTPLPAAPSFLLQSADPQAQISKVIKSILKAKRIVVICGAGISVQAGIPDFRSADGLFKSLKRDNPREALASGKDLFDASVFNSEHTTTLFCQMIAQLWNLSQAAKPTAFHNVMRSLDDRGKLLRVYTQNIDAIEEKCGLSFGVPEFEDKRCKPRSKATTTAADCLIKEPSPYGVDRLPCPPADPPRCIPLHGTLQSMHCQICNSSCPIEEHLPSLACGLPPQCPECTSMEETRQLIGKRARGVGKLRPSVVLYNEAHKDGEGVGEIVQKDLLGSSKGKGRSGADLLLVVGTSLRVPGTKRMVREFAKAVRSRGPGSSRNSPSPGSSLRPSPTTDEEPQMKAIYLNLDFPVPTREWEGVFDAWIQGDAQTFADMLQEEIDREARAKELALERKKRREEEAVAAALDPKPVTPKAPYKARTDVKTPKRKRSVSPSTPTSLSKRHKIECPLTPPKTPPTQSSTPKLFLRIPARTPQQPPRIPEVYITSTPPPHSKNTAYSRDQMLITPEKSPPRPEAGWSGARGSHTTRKVSMQENFEGAHSSDHFTAEELEVVGDPHVLPTFMRSVRYELRAEA